MPLPASHAGALLTSILLLAACSNPSSRADGPIADDAFLSSSLWDDGQAEVAFYLVRRSENQYGEAEPQEFIVGSYLVKHDFDPEAEAKAASDASQRVPTFKYALFYELESGSYQFKRSYVTNARRSDLRPVKFSFASFDWCSNQYRELSFGLGGTVDVLMRSDDYGNERREFDYAAHSYPPAQIPLLVRALSLVESDTTAFGVVLASGDVVGARAALVGRDSISTPAGSFYADRVEVRYERAAPSPIAEEVDLVETYWLAPDEARTLLRIEGSTGRYEMDLVEHLRSAYWEENVYDRLERVETRP